MPKTKMFSLSSITFKRKLAFFVRKGALPIMGTRGVYIQFLTYRKWRNKRYLYKDWTENSCMWRNDWSCQCWKEKPSRRPVAVLVLIPRPWCSPVGHAPFPRALTSGKAKAKWPCIMSEHRQNLKIAQTTKMIKRLHVLVNMSDCCFFIN